ncbi:D-cysteine desulfhydrase family protein [Candidatus Sumerlaeota bacterium]|nr:D-cysteine desulfhydrase family protein [Candidatus Sumerlaeota bacterium]
MTKTPPRIRLAQLPTPLVFLERLTRKMGGPRIYVKRDDLTGSWLTGNKVRKLEFSIAEAQAQGCDTIITCGAVQSNHCRATVLACASLGMKVHLILRGEEPVQPDGNNLLDYVGGAHISYHARDVYKRHLCEIANSLKEKHAAEGHKAFFIPSGASDGIGCWGYIHAAEELKRDFATHGIEPTCIICATGSGGTQSGLVLGKALHGLSQDIVGINICDDEKWFRDKITDDMTEWRKLYHQSFDVESLPINIIDGHVGPGYGEATPDVFETIKMVARLEGLILDPVYTGKAFNGMLKEIAKGRFTSSDTIVFIHTGGIFGLLAQREKHDFKA